MKRKCTPSTDDMKGVIEKKKEIIEKSSEITKSIMSCFDVKNEAGDIPASTIKSEQSEKKDDEIIISPVISKVSSVLVKSYNSYKGSDKILSFDLDDTLIKPTGNKKFSQGDKDWLFLYDISIIQKKLNEYIAKGYSLCIISNQLGITKGQTDKKTWESKLDLIMKELNLPFFLMAALEKDYYRKPAIGMLELLEKDYNNNIKINRLSSYFIGDAAGRLKSGNKPKDFSASDYKFALNAGLQFMTPEEFFLDQKQVIPKIDLDLHQYDNNTNDHIKYDPKVKEMIIMIGAPGSGKSTFTEDVLVPKGYARVNQDTLKTEKKCISVASDALSKGLSCVIDSTNAKKEKRKVFIEVAKKYKATIRCFVIKIPKDFAFHLNNLREINTERKHWSSVVNDIPIHTFFKNYEEPTLNEGLAEVVEVNFTPGPFKNNKDKEIFYMHS